MRCPNDWTIRECLLLCGGTTCLQIVLLLLSHFGIEVYVLRQITGFVLITFIPGILLLRILRIHNINVAESIAYSVGLSLALAMFSGAAINFLLPLINIDQPLNLWPITITLTIEIAALLFFTCLRDKNYAGAPSVNFKLLPNLNSILFLLIILLLIILGVKISDITGSNLMLVISLLLIAGVVCLAAFKRLIKPEIYPLALFIIGLSMLYQTTLMSPYLVGSDIYTEYQYYRYTVGNGIWDFSTSNPVNSCLSIVVLGPVYSHMMGIDGIWLFKAVYPILFALVPLILYQLFRMQIGSRPSFLAVFFFIAVPTFSLELISLCRQQVAELFLALVFLLMVENTIHGGRKVFLLAVFSCSIAISHYSIGFITVAYLLLAIPLLAILRSKAFINIWGKVTSRTGGLPENVDQAIQNAIPLRLLVIPVVIFVAFLLVWYSQVASGINLHFITNVLNFEVNAISEEIGVNAAFQIGNRPDLIKTAMGLDFFDVTWQGKLFRIFQYLTQLLIILGCFRLLLSPRGLKFELSYISLCVTSVGLLMACILFAGFAGILNATRWYHIALMTLAPFCIIGAETAWTILSMIQSRILHQKTAPPICSLDAKYLLFLTPLVLIPYFIFTSGLVFEFSDRKDISSAETPYSIALSSYRIDITGILEYKDVNAAQWLLEKCDPSYPIYTDSHSNKIAALYKYESPIYSYPLDDGEIKPGYLYFTQKNNERKQLTFASQGKPGLREHVSIWDIPAVSGSMFSSNRIYENGGAEILFKQ